MDQFLAHLGADELGAAQRDARVLRLEGAHHLLDAELLLAHALGIARERLLLTLDDQALPPGFAALVERRARNRLLDGDSARAKPLIAELPAAGRAPAMTVRPRPGATWA